MLTFKEKIYAISDEATLKRCSHQSTGIFYKLYNNAELMDDKAFKKSIIDSNDLIDVSMYDWIVSDVKTKRAQTETVWKNKSIEYEKIKTLLSGTEISKKKRYTLKNKLAILTRTMSKDCCFGGKALLRSITKHAQLSKKDQTNLTDEQKSEVAKNKELYERELAEFRSKRKTGIYMIGRANEKGNRKIKFDLPNNKIIFKPNSDHHIEIEIKSRRNKALLNKIQSLADAESLPLTVRITDTHVCISFDEGIVSGYNFESTEYKRIIKKHGITKKEGKK